MEEHTGLILTATNYSIWKTWMEDLLYCKDLIDPILTKGVKPTRQTDIEWATINRRAIAHIRQSIDLETFKSIVQETDAYRLWTKLEDMYGYKTVEDKVSLMSELMKLKYVEGQDMDDHVRVFKSLVYRLAKVGIVWNDKTLSMLLLCTLPIPLALEVWFNDLEGKLSMNAVEKALLSFDFAVKAPLFFL